MRVFVAKSSVTPDYHFLNMFYGAVYLNILGIGIVVRAEKLTTKKKETIIG